jgi:hypothetical protein
MSDGMVVSNGGTAVGRVVVDTETLDQMVRDVLAVNVTQQAGFTAYDVTKTLRGLYANYEIEHESVRALVHFHMQSSGPIQAGEYELAHVQYPTGTAMRYQPVPKGALPAPAASVPQLTDKSGAPSADSF